MLVCNNLTIPLPMYLCCYLQSWMEFYTRAIKFKEAEIYNQGFK